MNYHSNCPRILFWIFDFRFRRSRRRIAKKDSRISALEGLESFAWTRERLAEILWFEGVRVAPLMG